MCWANVIIVDHLHAKPQIALRKRVPILRLSTAHHTRENTVTSWECNATVTQRCPDCNV